MRYKAFWRLPWNNITILQISRQDWISYDTAIRKLTRRMVVLIWRAYKTFKDAICREIAAYPKLIPARFTNTGRTGSGRNARTSSCTLRFVVVYLCITLRRGLEQQTKRKRYREVCLIKEASHLVHYVRTSPEKLRFVHRRKGDAKGKLLFAPHIVCWSPDSACDEPRPGSLLYSREKTGLLRQYLGVL